MIVTNYILDFLKESEQYDLINKFNLQSFEMNVQTIERTLIDKIFAICDYFEKEQIHQNSRHLYDIHQIWSNSKFEKLDFLELLSKVATDRASKININISSEKGYKIVSKLNEIIYNRIYEGDYKKITQSLLFSTCTYDESRNSLKSIISSGFLPKKIGQVR